ncbi:COPII coat assembly protein SEC16 [Vairimorpha necatrix]|uniref:COPII coat assembly protein SEC16 n=1 Tax=Vairimorpha necatrix TaxID=6039 RepID=A0AAX4JA78_9MICR
MQNKSDQTFWSNDEESDEDFESIINSKKVEKTNESQNDSKILTSEKLDFLWSDDEDNNFPVNEKIPKTAIFSTGKEKISEEKEDYVNQENLEQNDKTNEEDENSTEEEKKEQINEEHFENIGKAKKYNNWQEEEQQINENNNWPKNEENENIVTEGNKNENLDRSEQNNVNEEEQINENSHEEEKSGNINREEINYWLEDEEQDSFYKPNKNDSTTLSDKPESTAEEKIFYSPEPKKNDMTSVNDQSDDLKEKKDFPSPQPENYEISQNCIPDKLDEANNVQDNVEEFIDTHNSTEPVNVGQEEVKNLSKDLESLNLSSPLKITDVELESSSNNVCTESLFFDDNEAEDESSFFSTINKTSNNLIEEETEVEYEGSINKSEEIISEADISKKKEIILEETKYEEKVLANESHAASNESDLPNEKSKGLISGDSKKFKLQTKRPLVCLFGNKVLTYYESIQPRYNTEGIKKDQSVNILTTFNLEKPSVMNDKVLTKSFTSPSLNMILSILNLKDIHQDNVADIIGAKSVKYTSKSYQETESMSNINTALNISTYNTNHAVDYCLNNKMWTLALILSKMDSEVMKNIYKEIIDEDMTSLFLNDNFVLKRHWKEYFKHFAYNSSKNLDNFIREVFKYNFEDGILVLVSLHLCKVLDIKDYLEYFSHKHDLCSILLFIHTKYNKIGNIDLLLYEYVCDIKDRDLETSREFYKRHKKEFRKELQNILDENFKLNWNFGIKEIVNFGISKILDVSEDEQTKIKQNENKCNKVDKEEEEQLDNNKKYNLNKKIYTKKTDNKKIYNKEELDSKKIYNKNEIYNVNRGEDIQQDNINNDNNKYVNINNGNTNSGNRDLYADQKHSKSFADFFEDDKNDKEMTSEDDTALFLSKYNLDEDKVGIKKEDKVVSSEPEEKSSFLSMFNIFKKKSYKIELKAADDIKYDPVTKKWVSGGNTPPKKEEIKGASIPKLNLPNKPSPTFTKNNPDLKDSVDLKNNVDLKKNNPDLKKNNVDLKKMSLYAGKKKTTSVGFNTFKKESN